MVSFQNLLASSCCSWERHFTALYPACWPWQAILNFNDIFIRFQAGNNILASLEAVRDDCLIYLLAPSPLPVSQEDKHKIEIKI